MELKLKCFEDGLLECMRDASLKVKSTFYYDLDDLDIATNGDTLCNLMEFLDDYFECLHEEIMEHARDCFDE